MTRPGRLPARSRFIVALERRQVECAGAGELDEHTPVLVDEVLAALAVRPAGLYVDATFGRGGHSARILAALGPQGRLIAIDRDRAGHRGGPRALRIGSRVLRLCMEPSASWRRCCARRIRAVRVYDGILIDCGVSSPQLDDAARGFSFQKDGPLDMRMDPTARRTRQRLARPGLARGNAPRDRDASGEERFARRIASAIERERAQRAADAHRAAGRAGRSARCRCASRASIRRRAPSRRCACSSTTSSASSQRALAQALHAAGAGRAAGGDQLPFARGSAWCAISSRSTQQRRSGARATAGDSGQRACRALRRIGRKQRASAAEVAANPRARSALLRVAERMLAGGA